MQKIFIIGWYGTETIGDRAILVGILKILSSKYSNLEIELGSLYPFYSQRTIAEDSIFINNICNTDIKIKIFDSTNYFLLKSKIKNSDVTIIGGGPLMDLECLYMVEYAFKLANKYKSKAMVMGCGIGPLFLEKYKKSVCQIIKRADYVVLRDQISKNNLREISKELNSKIDFDKIKVSLDPAVICCLEYLDKYEYTQNSKIVINLREPPLEYGIDKNNQMDTFLKKLIVELSTKYSNKEILLVPMHYFVIGGDDRDYLYKLTLYNKYDSNIIVQGKPLSVVAQT